MHIPPSIAYLTAHRIISKFLTVINKQIQSMQGKQCHISLVNDIKPFCVNTPRSISFAYHAKLKAALDLLQEQLIIVPIITATE